MGDMIRVRAAVPFKRGDVWFRPGDEAEVTPAEKAELARAGVIEAAPADQDGDAPAETDRIYTPAEFEAAVAARAQSIAEAVVDGAVAHAVEFLSAERDAARARVAELEAQLAAAPIPETGSDGRAQAADPVPAPKASARTRATRA